MATGNLILGTARKKLGDVVLSRRNGKQVARIRVTPRNPRSSGQLYSRLALSSAAKTAQQLRTIVSHSFQGIQYGQASVNHFTSRLAKEIRGAMSAALAKGSLVSPFGTAPVLPFQAVAVAAGARALISSGDLPSVPFVFDTGSPGGFLIGQPGIWATTPPSSIFVSNYAETIGVPVTDQLTFVVGAPVELDYVSEEELFYGVRFAYARLNFLQNLNPNTPIFTETQAGSGYFHLNTAAVDVQRTTPSLLQAVFSQGQNQSIAVLGPNDTDITGTFVDSQVCLGACICSRFEAGAWRRSTTRLLQNTMLNPTTNVQFEQRYGYNDVASVLTLADPTKAGIEDRFLNKEVN